ncbi:MAG: hypothetical protein ACM3UZ_15940 [Acidobacteriota bacterium]
MEKIITNLEQGTKMLNDMNDKVWEAYLKGFEHGLQLTKAWTEMVLSSVDMNKDAQNKMVDMTGEALKNLKSTQDVFQATYSDMVKQVLQNFSFKKTW